MSEQITLEDLKAIKQDTNDFGSPIYFLSEQQFNYCMWHLEDYNKTQEMLEAVEGRFAQCSKNYKELADLWEAAEEKLSKIGGHLKNDSWVCEDDGHSEYVIETTLIQAILDKDNA